MRIYEGGVLLCRAHFSPLSRCAELLRLRRREAEPARAATYPEKSRLEVVVVDGDEREREEQSG